MNGPTTDEEIEKLVTDNVNLARHFANKYIESLGEGEAFSCALDFLWRAARDWNRKIPFGTYAGMRLRWGMQYPFQAKKRKKRGGGTAVHVYLDAPLSDGERSLAEVIPDAREIGGSGHMLVHERQEKAFTLLSQLPDRKRKVLEMRFGFNGYDRMVLDEIAAIYGVTRERIRQIEKESLADLADLFAKEEKKNPSDGINVKRFLIP